MCRYGESRYKPHYACFGCRKAFKRRRKEDVNASGPDRPARCPQCGNLMADMGLDFAPPKARDEVAWRVLGELWTLGETFHSCGCGGPGYRPRSPAGYQEFLLEIRSRYAGFLRTWQGSGSNDRDVAMATWRERISRVDAAIAALRLT